MGARGPMPRPEAELARPRSRAGKDRQQAVHGVRREITSTLEADENWHPIAKELWESALSSGQADFYQNSDIAYLYSLCEEISEYKQSPKRSSMMFTAIMSAMNPLLLTEGDRRRVRVELNEPPQEKASLSVIGKNQYKDAVNG